MSLEKKHRAWVASSAALILIFLIGVSLCGFSGAKDFGLGIKIMCFSYLAIGSAVYIAMSAICWVDTGKIRLKPWRHID